MPLLERLKNSLREDVVGSGEDYSAAWPVGSVFICVVSTNPSSLLGFGTWESIGAGRVLVGLDSGDASFDVLEETGGVKTVASVGSNSTPSLTMNAYTPAGTNSVPTFTGSALATHTHTFTGNALGTHAHELPFQKVAGGTAVQRMLAGSVFGTGTARAAESQSAAPVANTTSAAVELSQAVSAGTPAGTNAAITAGTPAGTVSAPTFTGTQATLTGSVTASTFTGTATSVVQPYLVVNFWKRTA